MACYHLFFLYIAHCVHDAMHSFLLDLLLKDIEKIRLLFWTPKVSQKYYLAISGG